tara:strand:+ start:299 stop:466 length:168 start_codon:yes stop_codon:yes gene_type:complete
MYQTNKETKKFAKEVKTATFFEFFSIFFGVPLVKKIKKAPISGRKVRMDKIGKFI